ncbi:hypothetical protein HKD37_16G044999 [Glycine soja]
MEMEASPSPSPKQVVARKLWNIVRIVFLMLRKGISKSKLAADFNLNLSFKRGKLAATKAIANTILHRSQNDDAVYPRDYEFSCSNSPALFHVIKRSTNKHRHHHHRCTITTKFPHHDDVSTVQKVLEILNNNKVEASPLPGFGKSPIGRKLIRITDSPFPLKDEEGGDDNQVDVAAEEFIKRFYKDLNLQQKMAAIDSPYHYNLWDR